MRSHSVRQVGAVALAGISLAALSLPAHAAGGGTTAVKATIKKSVLTVTGSAGPDAITLRLRAGDPNTLEVDLGADGTGDLSFDRRRFSAIVVNGAAGDDSLVADHFNGTFTDTEPTTLDGGDGNDVVLGANGPERLAGGRGSDVLDGRLGADLVTAGDDDDVVRWNPGDASDTVDAGAGTDRLAFSGADIGEMFALSATGTGHVRFSRDIASVAMDLDNLEILDLAARSGADTLTVGDVTGTDLTTVNSDFAGADGADDAAADQLVVPAVVTLGQDGAAAVVTGLGAQLRMLGSGAGDYIRVAGSTGEDTVGVAGTSTADSVSAQLDGTDVLVQGATGSVPARLVGVEHLDTNLAGGDDTFVGNGNLGSVALSVDGGEGADTLTGSSGADALAGGNGPDVLDARQGVDQVSGGEGDDDVRWNPGDASDTVDAGSGTDRLAFAGANVAEMFGVSATGTGHVRFARDVASVVMDLDNLEVLDVSARAGADTVSVGDLTGTELATVSADLATGDGADDSAVDQVVVPAGVTLGQDGEAAAVTGLGAQVQVLRGGAGDFVRVNGSSGEDTLGVAGTSAPDTVSALLDGTDVLVQGATGGVPARLSGVEHLDADLGGGDDTFTGTGNLGALALDVDGGEGDDTLTGSVGADRLAGGAGQDVLDGRQGADQMSGGDGDDVVRWNPGDASDTVDAGAGADRMAFAGANIGEAFGVSATGVGHVRFSRDVAGVVLDLDNLEALDLATRSGTDTVTVGDLMGTDLGTVSTDLAASDGVGDGMADEVVVNGTAGNDAVAVVDDGSSVVVQGLAATVRVSHADPTLDRLTVNGLEGDDTVTPSPGAAALILLGLNP